MIVAILNQKGGVGKTTLALHLAGQWSREGGRVTLVDADPQGSALDWSEQRARDGFPRLFGVLGLARDTLHREAPGRPLASITWSLTARRASPGSARVGWQAAPLHAGKAPRPAPAEKDRRMTRSGWSLVAAIVVCGTSISSAFRPVPKLIWNASACVPIGLYAVHPAGALQIGELLAVSPPEPLAAFLDERQYLPKGLPLLKHVAALPGQTVCRAGGTITVDGIAAGVALGRDHLGRWLPTWQGCRVLAEGEVFLMNRRSPASLDGRYFGPLPTTTIVGRVDPIWIETERQP